MYIRYPNNNSVLLFPTFADFPAAAANGTLALALNTDILYAYNTTSISWVVIGGPGTILSVGTIDSQTPSANGASIVANLLYMQSADATRPGLVNNTTQTLSGAKTFSNTITGTTSGNLTLATPHNHGVLLAGTANATSAITPDSSTTKVLVSGGASADPSWQDIASGALALAAVGSTPNANAASLSAGTLNLQPANGSFPGVITISAQTIAGVKTFSSAPNLSSLSASLPLQLDSSKNIVSSAIDLSGAQATGILAAARFPALTGDVTTSVGAVATTVALVGGSAASAVNTATVLVNSAQSGNKFLASPANGSSAAPAFRAITSADIPALGYVTSVALSVPSFLSIAGSPITSSGTLAVSYSGTALPVANGGMGLTSGTSGGILGFTASGTLTSSAALTVSQLIIGGGAGATPSTLAAGSQYQVLRMGATTPAYGSINLDQSAAVTGALAIGNGGTGQITKAAGFDALSPMTTGGDLIYGGASGTGTRLANGTAGYFLQSAGTTLAPVWAQLAAASFGTQTAGTFLAGPTSGSAATPTFRALQVPTRQVLTNGSGATYTTPAGVLWLRVRLVGAGASGGASGTEGGSAATGTASSFGALTASGGVAGGGVSADGGAGGAASGGNISNLPGQKGAAGGAAGGGSTVDTGDGGAAGGGMGAGGRVGFYSQNGFAGVNYGGGGGGGGSDAATNSAGGGGGAGYVEHIYTSPAATYTYTVSNTGAAAATAGTNGHASGAGAPGLIIVEEFYQ